MNFKSLLLSLLALGACHLLGEPPSSPLVLVTGCGRSGTVYTSWLFNKAGYFVDHEKETGSFGTVSWYLLFEQDRKRHYDVILHQIRSPLEAIASISTLQRYSWEYIFQRLPECTREDSFIESCAKYWLYWNKKAESIAHLSYPVERISDYIDQINQLTKAQIDKELVQYVSKKANTRPHPPLTWQELKNRVDIKLYEEIKAYAKKWGYDTPLD